MQQGASSQSESLSQTDGHGQSQTQSWSVTRLVFVAVGLAIIVRIFIFQPYNIPSTSMQPNLLVGDFLYVSKTSYGYSRASLIWPLTKIPVRGRVFAKYPERGDIVVFKNKKDGNRDYIKRLIGLPGDEIFIREGTIYVNGVAFRRDYLGTASGYCDGYLNEKIPVYRETLSTGLTYRVHECHGVQGYLDTKGPYKVPTGHYFVMGDNRDQSRDSRVEAEVGSVPFDDLVGKAQRVMVSVDGSKGKPWQFWKWPSAIRNKRVFKSLSP